MNVRVVRVVPRREEKAEVEPLGVTTATRRSRIRCSLPAQLVAALFTVGVLHLTQVPCLLEDLHLAHTDTRQQHGYQLLAHRVRRVKDSCPPEARVQTCIFVSFCCVFLLCPINAGFTQQTAMRA